MIGSFLRWALDLALHLIIAIFWSAFVGATLWGWFMVPLGVKAVTYWHMLGVSALLTVLIAKPHSKPPRGEASDNAWLSDVVQSAGIPAVCLGIGWLAKINL